MSHVMRHVVNCEIRSVMSHALLPLIVPPGTHLALLFVTPPARICNPPPPPPARFSPPPARISSLPPALISPLPPALTSHPPCPY